jgi:hypothetical protein
MIEKVFIFSLRTQTANITVSKGPKFKKIETLTIGRERMQTKIIIMMKQMWPSPTAKVFTLSYLKGRVRLVTTDVFVIFAATGVSKTQQIRASRVTKRKGETVGSIVLRTLISMKLVLKHTVEISALIAAYTGRSLTGLSSDTGGPSSCTSSKLCLD